MRKIYLIAIAFALFAVSCKKSIQGNQTITKVTDINKVVTPKNFNYRTTHDVAFKINLSGMDKLPFIGVPVTINKVDANGNLVLMYTLMSNKNGLASGVFSVPSKLQNLVVSCNYVGLKNNIMVATNNATVSVDICGTSVKANSAFTIYHPSMASTNNTFNVFHSNYFTAGKTDAANGPNLDFSKCGNSNTNEYPVDTVAHDVVSTAFLTQVSNTFPEGQYNHARRVPAKHPNFLKKDSKLTIDLIKSSDVYFTWLYENSSYNSTICYYTYPTNNPPKTISDIKTATVLIPNIQAQNLKSGTKLLLGNFSAGTSIGFYMITLGWSASGHKAGTGGLYQMYSNNELNGKNFTDTNIHISTNTPEIYEQQSIMLYDAATQYHIFAWKDQARATGGDDDFNDAIFGVTLSDNTAMDNTGIYPLDNATDSDLDGVSDVYDDYPNDASLAYKSYLPDASDYGYLAYEDLWPSKGDYDFNDIVIGYQYEQHVKADGSVKEMIARFPVYAIGAHFYHGFGFQLPGVASSTISSVTYSYDNSGAATRNAADLSNYSFNSNGTEAGQTNATFLAMGNDYNFMGLPNGSFMNTLPGHNHIAPYTVTMDIVFTDPITLTATAPYNAFIWDNGQRGHEIHLGGQAPTDLATTSLFGTSDDRTNTSTHYYYKTGNGLPWGLDVPDLAFVYPNEGVAINNGYNHFIDWAQSGGSSFLDWWDNINNYRNNGNLFH